MKKRDTKDMLERIDNHFKKTDREEVKENLEECGYGFTEISGEGGNEDG